MSGHVELTREQWAAIVNEHRDEYRDGAYAHELEERLTTADMIDVADADHAAAVIDHAVETGALDKDESGSYDVYTPADDEQSDGTPDPKEARARFAAHLEEAGVRERRFIDVKDGEKGTRTRGHQETDNWLSADADELYSNYGVHPGHGLIELDVDDYDDEHDTKTLDRLPETFTVASAHTAPDEPGHRYYAVDDDDAVHEALKDVAGTLNPEPSWGEVKYEGKYVVGPGSQLDGCTKEWCDACDEPDGGYYRIAEDVPIATITAEDIAEVLRTDPEIRDGQSASELFDVDEYDVDHEGESGGGDDYDGDEWLTEDVVKDVLDAIDPDVDYDEWMGVGFSLVNHFGRSTGGHLFEQWSRGGSEWDDDAPYYVEYAIENAGKYPYGVAHLVNRGKAHGWDASAAAREAVAEQRDVPERYRDDDGELDDESNGGELPRPAQQDIDVVAGHYGTWERNGDEEYFNEITNFELELNWIVNGRDETVMSITVQPANEPEYDIEVSPTALNEVRAFKNEVCTGATTTFDGNSHDLTQIKQFVGSQDAPRKVGVEHMGYHRDGDRGVWVTPNGNIGPAGWIEDTDQTLLEERITAEEKWRLEPDDGDEYDSDDVAEILELLPQTRDSERLLPLLGWFYAASVRPLIHDWTEQFNFASVTGETGSGKTTTLATLWSLFGMDPEPMSADSTSFVLMATLASTNSIPMWFDEYKPSDMAEYKVNNFHNDLRKATRGAVGQRGNADRTTDEYPMHAPVVVSGEERIQGSAEERRGIFTSFKKSATREGSQTAQAAAKLMGTATTEGGDTTYFDGFDFDEHALAWVRWITAREHDELEALWRDADAFARETLADAGVDGIGNLALQGLQTVKFGCDLYRRFYADMSGNAGDAVFTDSNVADALTFAVSGNVGGTECSHLDILLDVASRAAREGTIEENEHYTFTRKGKDNEELRINLGTSFDKIKKYAREHEVSEDLLNNKHDYDQRLDDEGETIEWLTNRSQNSPPIGRAIGVGTTTAEAEIEGFSRWMWDEDQAGSQGNNWQPLNTGRDGRVNVTVEVVSSSSDTPPKMAESGTLADKSSAVDYVMWESDAAAVPELVEGNCYAIKGARLDEYDGAPQLVLDSGVSSIEEVQQGFGHTSPPEAATYNTSLDAAAATAADGGVDQLAPTVEEIVGDEGPISRDLLVGIAYGQADEYTKEDVEGAVDRLLDKGRLANYGDGYELAE